MENWRFIEANSDYMVSDHGRILSFKGKSKLIISSSITAKGYEYVAIRQKGIYVGYSVHRLVATAFIPNPKRLPQVNHLDGNKLNNHVSNLEWCDAYDNAMHAIRTGLRPPAPALSSVPCAMTDETGNILQAYPSMNALVKGEQMNPKQRNWLVLHLLHPERLQQWAMSKKIKAEKDRSEDCFLIVPDLPAASDFPVMPVTSNVLMMPAVSDLTAIPAASGSFAMSAVSDLTAIPAVSDLTAMPAVSGSPVHHSVTQHYYRRLSPEECAIFGFNTYVSPRQRREVLQ